LRYHDGKFWVFVIDPTEGLFMSTAEKAEGPWAPLHKVSDKLRNHDDCCPLWDDDGQAYLVCSDFSTRPYQIAIFRMSPDGRELLDAGTVVHTGPVAEANKLYKRGEYYYLMHTEEPGRKQWIRRAKSIYGPYEGRIILQSLPKDRYKPVTQGALVELKDGRWIYIGQSNYTTVWGWPLALLPVEWSDGWPLVGKDINNDGIGEMIWEAEKPIQGEPVSKLQTSDEFDSQVLQPQWEFNFQPMPGAWSLTERPGFLRMHAMPPLKGNPRNSLTQRLTGLSGTITTKMELSGMADGQQAGLCCYGSPTAWLIVEQIEGKRAIRFSAQNKVEGPQLPAGQNTIWLRMTHKDAQAQFAYSLDGQTYIAIGGDYTMSKWSWMGARPALFNFNPKESAGYVDVDWFHDDYDMDGRHPEEPR